MSDLPVWAVRLRAERQAREWSLKDMTRRLAEAASDHTRARLPTRESLTRMVRSWEAGKHRPSEPYPRLFAKAFGVAEADLFAAGNAPSTPPPPVMSVLSAASLYGHVGAAVIESLLAALAHFPPGVSDRERWPEGRLNWDAFDGGAMDRRTAMQFLSLFGAGALTSPNALDTILSGVDRAIGDREDLGVGDWERIAWEYSFRTNTGPLGALVGDLTADIAEVGRLLDRTTSPSARAGLLRVTVSLAQTLSGEFTHIRATSQARRSQRTARRAADASGDRDLRVSVRASEAWNSFASGHPPQLSLRLLDDAIRISGGVPSAALARTYAARATMLAAQSAEWGGDGAAARTALDDLRTTWDRLPDRATADELTYWGFTERALRFTEAEVFALLGDTREAVRAADRAYALYSPALVHGIANLRLIRAHSLIREREVSEGLDHALTGVQGPPITPYRRRIIGHVIEALPERARTLPAARELRALTVAAKGAA